MSTRRIQRCQKLFQLGYILQLPARKLSRCFKLVICAQPCAQSLRLCKKALALALTPLLRFKSSLERRFTLLQDGKLRLRFFKLRARALRRLRRGKLFGKRQNRPFAFFKRCIRGTFCFFVLRDNALYELRRLVCGKETGTRAFKLV